MIDVSEATSILAKLIAGGKLTEQERQEIDEYANLRFIKKKKQNHETI